MKLRIIFPILPFLLLLTILRKLCSSLAHKVSNTGLILYTFLRHVGETGQKEKDTLSSHSGSGKQVSARRTIFSISKTQVEGRPLKSLVS